LSKSRRSGGKPASQPCPVRATSTSQLGDRLLVSTGSLRALDRVEHVYFPDNGVVVSLLIISGSIAAEVGMVGNEGMAGLSVFRAETTPFRAIVQVQGDAMRMKEDVFKASVNKVMRFTPAYALRTRC